MATRLSKQAGELVRRARDQPVVAILAICAVAAVALVFADIRDRSITEVGSALPSVDNIPYDGRSPRQATTTQMRVIVGLRRPPLGQRRDLDEMTAVDRSKYVRSLLREGDSLREALSSRGVRFRDVRRFGVLFNGFAATVATDQVGSLSSLGVRIYPTRRFFPAISEPIQLATRRAARVTKVTGAPIAVLDTGATAHHGVLAGYDVIERRSGAAPQTDPRNRHRVESSGNLLAQLLTQSGRRAYPIRVASFDASGIDAARTEIAARTDTLIAGLEHAVDPRGDHTGRDPMPVALIGVNAPYSSFPDSPEEQAINSATRLGTLVVCAAGNEGVSSGFVGTIGSPGGARSALTLGAMTTNRHLGPTLKLRAGSLQIAPAVLIAGKAPQSRLKVVAKSGKDAEELPQPEKLRGRAVVIERGANPVEQIARAAAAGAAIVVLAQVESGRIPSIPISQVGVPVLAVAGRPAQLLLEKEGADIEFELVHEGTGATRPLTTPFSSVGPTLGQTPKPELLAPGVAELGSSTRSVVVAGSAMAAAKAAIYAARVREENPRLAALSVRDLLREAGAKRPDITAGQSVGGVLSYPRSSTLRTGVAKTARKTSGPSVPVEILETEEMKGKVDGVRFSVGLFERDKPLDQGTTIIPASRLRLELLNRDGKPVRTLSPAGDVREVLPGTYEYRLTRRARSGIPQDRYRFRITAIAPFVAEPTVKRSNLFDL